MRFDAWLRRYLLREALDTTLSPVLPAFTSSLFPKRFRIHFLDF